MGENNNWPLALLIIAGAVGLVVAYGQFRDAGDLARFDPKLKAWATEPARASPGTASVRGRVRPVLHTWHTTNVRGPYPAVDWALYWKLPDDLRARTPDEVGTVLWLDWTEKTRTAVVARNSVMETSKITTIIETCKVTLIDVRANRRLASRIFRGKDPDKVAPGEEPVDRLRPEPPYQAIRAYLEGLPKASP
jgi:hypothetical protein